MARKKLPQRRGTLTIIAGFLIASAVIRVTTQTPPALAEEAAPSLAIDTQVAPVEVDKDLFLAALQDREARLDEREAQLLDRIQALSVAEMEIDEKLAALIVAEERLSATIVAAESASATDVNQLTAVYENMKPREAAALFEEMPPEFAAGFLAMMQPDAAAMIMTELAPETAYSFSVVLAGRNANTPTR